MALKLFDNEHYLALQSVNEGQMLDHIPGHVYRIAMTPDGPILTKDRKRFEVGERRYGDFQKRFDLVVNHYDPTMSATGVLLIGLAGGGKSMLCEALSNWALGRDMPVLVIDKPWPASLVLTMVKLMGQCVVYFDEFGKIYPHENKDGPDQQDFLTYFSDTSLTGVINLVTANDVGELLSYFFNRPQRFRFRFRYSDITAAEIEEIASEHHLKDWQRLQMLRMGASYGLSWNMARDIALTLRNCASPEDAKDQLQYLNVPGWVHMTCQIAKIERHGEEVIHECIQARFLNESILQIRILHEDTGELVEALTVPFDNPIIMGEAVDTMGFMEYESQWASMESYGMTRSESSRNAKQNQQNLSAGRVKYPFVRPVEHIRLHLETMLDWNTVDPTQVGVNSITRYARNLRREEATRSMKDKEAGKDVPLSRPLTAEPTVVDVAVGVPAPVSFWTSDSSISGLKAAADSPALDAGYGNMAATKY